MGSQLESLENNVMVNELAQVTTESANGVNSQPFRFEDGLVSKKQVREMIKSLEASFKLLPQIEIPLKHYYSPGVYGREIKFEKGNIIIGKIHKGQTMNVISSGEVSVFSVDGVMRIKAPHTFVSSPGAKRVIVAHEDSVWTTFHGTTETDVEKIEEAFIAKDYDEVYLAGTRSFKDAIDILGYDEEELTAISENTLDRCEFPEGTVGIEVKESDIHGKGLFATQDFKKDQKIAPARSHGLRTPAGRYSNHSGSPNAEMVNLGNGNIELTALNDINPGDEIVTDYFFNFINTRSSPCLG